MKKVLIASVVVFLLCSTTNITAYASTTLISTLFRTNLVKGEYVEAEAEEIITDRAEIAKPEPQGSDEYTDIATPSNIESVVIEDTGDLDQLEEPVDEQLDAPENTGDSTEPEVETPIDSETEEKNDETEVQEPE